MSDPGWATSQTSGSPAAAVGASLSLAAAALTALTPAALTAIFVGVLGFGLAESTRVWAAPGRALAWMRGVAAFGCVLSAWIASGTLAL